MQEIECIPQWIQPTLKYVGGNITFRILFLASLELDTSREGYIQLKYNSKLCENNF